MLKVRYFRELKGLSQRDVAKILEITQASYWRLEKGISLLNSNQIVKLCDLFGCTPNDLLDFKTQYQIIMNETYHSKK